MQARGTSAVLDCEWHDPVHQLDTGTTGKPPALPMYHSVNQIPIRDGVSSLAKAFEPFHLTLWVIAFRNSSRSVLEIVFLFSF